MAALGDNRSLHTKKKGFSALSLRLHLCVSTVKYFLSTLPSSLSEAY